jgi:carbonic anhydrase
MTDPDPLPPELLDGYHRFRSGRFAEDHERYRVLAEQGQRPTAMLIACSDSRSAPEQVFDAAPGELFVVRNIAAWVPPYRAGAEARSTAAALEYAIHVLPIASIVVMGHAGCGGVRAALDRDYGPSTSEFVGPWIRDIEALARDVVATGPDLQHAVELRTVERSVENLMTYPWIAGLVRAEMLAVAGARFAIATGELEVLGDHGWEHVEGG